MTKRELSKLMGTKNAMQASIRLYPRLEKRNWRTESGKPFRCSGLDLDNKKYGMYLQLTNITSIETGVVSYRIIRVPLETAIDCLSGQLQREDYWIAA